MARFNWAQFIFMEWLHPTTNRGDILICLMDWQVKNGWLAKEGWSKLEKMIIKRSHLLSKEQMQHKTIAILKSNSNMFKTFVAMNELKVHLFKHHKLISCLEVHLSKKMKQFSSLTSFAFKTKLLHKDVMFKNLCHINLRHCLKWHPTSSQLWYRYV
jgi:hypothetical protein